MKGYKANIRNFVEQGGRYMGFCLGAYLAGHSPGFDLLDKKDDTDAECDEPGAQVPDEREAIIQVDWTFSTGPEQGHTDPKRWLYFQDGAVIELHKRSTAKVLGRYSSTQDVAASLSSFGKGWVGLVGPHPEAGQDWCKSPVEWERLRSRTDVKRQMISKISTARKASGSILATISWRPSCMPATRRIDVRRERDSLDAVDIPELRASDHKNLHLAWRPAGVADSSHAAVASHIRQIDFIHCMASKRFMAWLEDNQADVLLIACRHHSR